MNLSYNCQKVALLDIEAVGRLTMSVPEFDVSVFSKVTFVTGFDELNCVSNIPDDVSPVEALDVTNEEELEGRGDLVEVLLITVELEGMDVEADEVPVVGQRRQMDWSDVATH